MHNCGNNGKLISINRGFVTKTDCHQVQNTMTNLRLITNGHQCRIARTAFGGPMMIRFCTILISFPPSRTLIDSLNWKTKRRFVVSIQWKHIRAHQFVSMDDGVFFFFCRVCVASALLIQIYGYGPRHWNFHRSKREITGKIQFNPVFMCIQSRRTFFFSKNNAHRGRNRHSTTKIRNVFHTHTAQRSIVKWGSVMCAPKQPTDRLTNQKKSLCRRDSFDTWQHNNFRNYISLIKLFY